MRIGVTASAMDEIAGGAGGGDLETLRGILGQLKDKVAGRALAGVRLDGPAEPLSFAGAALAVVPDWHGSGEPVIMTEEEAGTFDGAGWHPDIFHLEL